MKQFEQQTKIGHLVYRPYWLSVTPFLQTSAFSFADVFYKYWYPEQFDREIFIVEDGGTLGIDWAFDQDTGYGRPNPKDSKSKPILIISPGLGGGSRNLYTIGLLWAARKSGFKVGTMLFRGAEDLPITSGKLSYGGAWKDCKSIIDHIDAKYVRKDGNQGRKSRMYAYGCSLGAQILGLYLRKEG